MKSLSLPSREVLNGIVKGEIYHQAHSIFSWSLLRDVVGGYVGKASVVIFVIGWVIHFRELAYRHFPVTEEWFKGCSKELCISMHTRIDLLYLGAIMVMIGYSIYIVYSPEIVKSYKFERLYEDIRRRGDFYLFRNICKELIEIYDYIVVVEYAPARAPKFSLNESYSCAVSDYEEALGKVRHFAELYMRPTKLTDEGSDEKYLVSEALNIYYIINDKSRRVPAFVASVFSFSGIIIVSLLSAESIGRVMIGIIF